MNAFINALANADKTQTDLLLKRHKLSILQVNMGNRCNQSCMHCHVAASPDGKLIMPKKIIDEIIDFLKSNKGLVLDITGGAPELNPHFNHLVENCASLAKEIIVRSNLTVLFVPGKNYLFEFFKKNSIHLICSLPCYSEQNVDSQRGKGVFAKSIKALLLLNNLGYAKDKKLLLDIVYNPAGPFLPSGQAALELDYRKNLAKYGVTFNRLLTMTNAPLRRFREFLDKQSAYNQYIEILKDNFNSQAAQNLMCRSLLSVGHDGKLYDCDFNQSLGWALKNGKGDYLSLKSLVKSDLEDKEIIFGEHCFSCTAGQGSSCHGVLIKNG